MCKIKYALQLAHDSRISCLKSLAVTVLPASKHSVIALSDIDAGAIELVAVTSTITVSDKLPTNAAVVEGCVAFNHPVRKTPMKYYFFPTLLSPKMDGGESSTACIIPFWHVGTTSDHALVNMKLQSITMDLVGKTVLQVPVLVNTVPICKGDVLLIYKDTSQVRKFYGTVEPRQAPPPAVPPPKVTPAKATPPKATPPKASPPAPPAKRRRIG